ncbi:LytR/AlgR family response regulator transcription factor [Foetidibacter luteolus]|uniref:LytR/AlgR family response regulator transcription factor n=1 Tax=Foetidibacter luteolus TaxID=2608880 RepID=UPI00129B7EA7|nr:LytTR family DNA-binding domain-containing protein [Foetidibacter luteolus]
MNTPASTIQCLLVDDEPLAREVLKRYIAEVPLLRLAGECANAVETLVFLQSHPVDIIFLDIRMPQLNGTDLVRTVKNLPKVIFTTAYSEYALEGYELDIVDYLMKPVRFHRFLQAVNKAFSLQQYKPVVAEAPAKESRDGSFVYLRVDRKMIKVLFSDILYVESMKDYVKVVTAGATLVTKQSLSSVEAMLPESLFMRIHRSFIVSADKIKAYTGDSIEVGKPAISIPIGKLYRDNVQKRLA